MTQQSAERAGEPSRRVVDQRGRNQVIEYLEVASSFEKQLEYERNVPIAYIPAEVICLWQDCVWKDPREDPHISDVYDTAEVQAMGQFHGVWDQVASALPDNYPRLSEVQALPEWQQLRDTAAATLEVFMRRGKMPEDHEVEN